MDDITLYPMPAAIAVILIFTTSLLFFFFNHYVVRASIRGSTRHLPPGPRQWPVVGNLITMLPNKPYFRWVLSVADGNDITCLRFFSVHVIIVNSPQIAREFLKTNDTIYSSRPTTISTQLFSQNYKIIGVTPMGDQWKKMRRVVASEVIGIIKKRSQEILRLEEADHLTKYVYNMCSSGETIDVRKVARYYPGIMIRRMLFGTRHFGNGGEHGGPGEEELEHIRAAFVMLSKVFTFRPSDFLPSLSLLEMDEHEKTMKEAMKIIDKYHDPIIDERLEKWKAWREGTNEDSNNSGGDGSTKMEVDDILDAFMALKCENGKPLLDRTEISAQVAELTYAIVDNISNCVEWTLAELLNQPKILRKAMEELDRVVGKDRLVQEYDFPSLPYVKACARETFRLHPISALNLPHLATSDAIVGGYFIPKGSWIMLSRVGLGRNPKVWDDPMRYDPERHLKNGLTDVEVAEPELRFISFTTGRRGCIGVLPGSLMTYMLLARLLQAFDWSTSMPVDLTEEEGSLFMAKSLWATAKPRLPEGLLKNL